MSTKLIHDYFTKEFLEAKESNHSKKHIHPPYTELNILRDEIDFATDLHHEKDLIDSVLSKVENQLKRQAYLANRPDTFTERLGLASKENYLLAHIKHEINGIMELIKDYEDATQYYLHNPAETGEYHNYNTSANDLIKTLTYPKFLDYIHPNLRPRAKTSSNYF